MKNVHLLQNWIQALKRTCGPQQLRSRSGAPVEVTQIRTLYMTIYEGKSIPAKLAPHPYICISLNQVKVGKTSVKSAPDPSWEEDFLFEEIPPDVTLCNLTLVNKRGKDNKAGIDVAYVDLDLESVLTSGGQRMDHEIEKWIPLSGCQTPIRDDYGCLRIKVRFVHEVILPFRDYSSFRDLICGQDLEVVSVLEQLCHRDRASLAHALLRIFR